MYNSPTFGSVSESATMKSLLVYFVIVWVFASESLLAIAFTPLSTQLRTLKSDPVDNLQRFTVFVRCPLDKNSNQETTNSNLETSDSGTITRSGSSIGIASVLGATILTAPSPANAVITDVVTNALVAYSHYFFILLTMGLLVYERCTIEAGMSKETEKGVVIADALYGINALFLFASGYLRVIDYGKGWEFYSHEPMFWLKISAASLLAGLSAFPTLTLIRRGVPIFQGRDVEPMSESLAKRMKQVINAEISAILTIPLLATLMARGVSYNNEFPWQAGAAFVTLVFVGSGFLYAKQALSWKEDVPTELTD